MGLVAALSPRGRLLGTAVPRIQAGREEDGVSSTLGSWTGLA